MIKGILLSILLVTSVGLFAEASQGEMLESQMWGYIKEQKWKDLESNIAPYFQYARFDEVLNKNSYLEHAKGLSVSNFILNNFKVTEGSDTKIVTYEITVSEVVDGKRFTSKANRLSVWQKNRDQWQWVAHAVLIPVPPSI